MKPVPSLLVATKRSSVVQFFSDDLESTLKQLAAESVTSLAFVARENKVFALNRKGELLSFDLISNESQKVYLPILNRLI